MRGASCPSMIEHIHPDRSGQPSAGMVHPPWSSEGEAATFTADISIAGVGEGVKPPLASDSSTKEPAARIKANATLRRALRIQRLWACRPLHPSAGESTYRPSAIAETLRQRT